MNPYDQAIFVLKVFINIAPIALYFLVLGLLNSQPRPRLVSGRNDFIALTLVFVPMLVWPVPLLLAHNLWPLLLVGLLALAAAFLALLPAKRSSWVIYNITEPRCRRHLEHALACLHPDYRRRDGGYWIPSHQLSIHVASFAPLRNVTLYIRLNRKNPPVVILDRLRDNLEAQLHVLGLLPSPTGACLLLVGVLLLMLPLWMINHHADVIVEAITHLLFA